MVRLRCSIALLLAGCAGTAPEPVHQTPAAYVADALAHIKRDSLSVAIDPRPDKEEAWVAFEKYAEERARDAKCLSDAHDILSKLMELLNDDHSRFISPEQFAAMKSDSVVTTGCLIDPQTLRVFDVLPGSAAERACLRPGYKVVRLNGSDVSEMNGRDVAKSVSRGTDGAEPGSRVRPYVEFEGPDEAFGVVLDLSRMPMSREPVIRKLGDQVAYVELSRILAQPASVELVERFHGGLEQLGDVKAIIVDLRRNTGGNSWQMLACVGAMVATSSSGPIKLASMHTLRGSNDCVYESGEMRWGDRPVVTVSKPPRRDSLPRLVVLVSEFTASAGELAAIALRGQGATLVGEATDGATTSTVVRVLSDGAALMIADGFMGGSDGKAVHGALNPDVPMKVDWDRFGAPDDPLILEALRVLTSNSQPAAKQ